MELPRLHACTLGTKRPPSYLGGLIVSRLRPGSADREHATRLRIDHAPGLPVAKAAHKGHDFPPVRLFCVHGNDFNAAHLCPCPDHDFAALSALFRSLAERSSRSYLLGRTTGAGVTAPALCCRAVSSSLCDGSGLDPVIRFRKKFLRQSHFSGSQLEEQWKTSMRWWEKVRNTRL